MGAPANGRFSRLLDAKMFGESGWMGGRVGITMAGSGGYHCLLGGGSRESTRTDRRCARGLISGAGMRSGFFFRISGEPRHRAAGWFSWDEADRFGTSGRLRLAKRACSIWMCNLVNETRALAAIVVNHDSAC